ncbi:MAG: ankyrin repeat domain-containing protein [Planctomycetota bacterium]
MKLKAIIASVLIGGLLITAVFIYYPSAQPETSTERHTSNNDASTKLAATQDKQELEENPNAFGTAQWPVLVEAAYRGNHDEVKRLLALGADVDKLGPEKWTALMQAAGHGHEDIVKDLLDAGAFINRENSAQKNARDLAVERGYDNVADLLYERGAADDELRAFIENTLDGSEKLMHEMILGGFDPNRIDFRGRTALFYALVGDRERRYYDRTFQLRRNMIKRLLDNGANPDIQDLNGKSPLLAFITEYGTNEQIIGMLLEAGADVNIADSNGQNLLFRLYKPELVEVLIDKGINLNHADKNGLTPLHWYVQSGRHEMVALLLQRGSDPTIEAKDGRKPIDMLPQRNGDTQFTAGHEQIFQMLHR